MNASSESGLWATWMVVDKGLEGLGCGGRGLRTARLCETGVDLVHVLHVLVELLCPLGGRRGDEAAHEFALGARLAAQPRGVRGEEKAEQMCGLSFENGIRLRPRERLF